MTRSWRSSSSDRGVAEVRAELDVAHDNGITAVPTYVINGRWAIPGAQEPETFAQVLRKMADQALASGLMRHDAVRPTDRFVLAHGFTQTARSWRDVRAVAPRAAPRRRRPSPSTCPDTATLPRRPTVDLWTSAERLVDAGGPGTYVGYSMGGRVALHAALAHPERGSCDSC